MNPFESLNSSCETVDTAGYNSYWIVLKSSLPLRSSSVLLCDLVSSGPPVSSILTKSLPSDLSKDYSNREDWSTVLKFLLLVDLLSNDLLFLISS